MSIRLALFLVLWSIRATAQVEPPKADGFSIPGSFDTFTTDDLGNVYALAGDELRLFDGKGRSWLRNSVKTFGRIGYIDAFYSLKPMLFAPEQGQIAVLDNTLSLQGSVINLPRSGYPQVVAACLSVQNCFWFFDQRELALVRVDAQLRKIADTGRLDQLLGFAPEPRSMQEHESRLYVSDKRHGVLVFDLFGTFMRTLPIKDIISFEVRGNVLWSFTSNGFIAYDLLTFEQHPVPMPPDVDNIRDVRVERGMLYLLTPAAIEVRPLTLP